MMYHLDKQVSTAPHACGAAHSGHVQCSKRQLTKVHVDAGKLLRSIDPLAFVSLPVQSTTVAGTALYSAQMLGLRKSVC